MRNTFEETKIVTESKVHDKIKSTVAIREKSGKYDTLMSYF